MENKIDLNQADRETLAGLPGIGEKLAGDIIEYRETVGRFTDLQELTAVSGISERMVQDMEAQVTLTAVKETAAPAEVTEVVDPVPDLPGEKTPVIAVLVEEQAEPLLLTADEQQNDLPDEETVTAADGTEVVDPVPDLADEKAPVIAVLAEEQGESLPLTDDEQQNDLPGDEPQRPDTPQDLVVVPSPGPAASGNSFLGYFFTALIGAIFGTMFTLLIIWLLNGSLRLNEAAQVHLLEEQSRSAAATVQADQADLRAGLGLLSEQFSAMTTRESEAAGQLEVLQSDSAEMDKELIASAKKVTALQTAAAGLDERISSIAVSAEKFDAFLNGLRDLLSPQELPSSTPTISTPEPAATGTAVATRRAEITETPKTTPTVTPTTLATRTPRPTATLIRGATPAAR